MSTPTPRTDAAIWPYITFDGAELVPADYARTLERELEHERERSRLLSAAMNERDAGYFESRKRMSALESELTAKGQAVRNLADVISGQDKELAREREKVRTLRLACDQICEEWGINHDANPIGAGQRMSTRAGKALEATEDAT